MSWISWNVVRPQRESKDRRRLPKAYSHLKRIQYIEFCAAKTSESTDNDEIGVGDRFQVRFNARLTMPA